MARRPGGARAADGSGARKEMTEENDLKDGSGAQPGNRRPDERARRRARPQRVFDTSVPSPCIAVCKVDPASNLCIGCRRHVDEIREWPIMTAEQKLAVPAALPGRDRKSTRLNSS